MHWKNSERAPGNSTLQKKLLTLLVAGLLLVSTLAFLDRFNWLLFLLNQFRVQYLWLGLVCLVWTGLRRDKRLFAMSALSLLMNVFGTGLHSFYLPQALASSSNAANLTKLRLLEMNVEYINRRHADAAEFIKNTNPDVIVIEELTPLWLNALNPVLKEYPYQRIAPREDTYGNGVFSRIPIRESITKEFGERKHPLIKVDLDFGNRIVSVVHTHLQGPVSPRYYKMHLDDAAGVREFLQGSGENVILCGDMNTASWCYPLSGVVSDAKLLDTRLGRGIQLSWPTQKKTIIPLLPIDNCFVRGNIRVTDRTLGPSFGSDHFPVIVDFAMDNH